MRASARIARVLRRRRLLALLTAFLLAGAWVVLGSPGNARADGPSTFSNTTSISIPSVRTEPYPRGPANPYPSTISVSGMAGVVTKVQVRFNNLTAEGSAADIDALVVAPSGANLIVLSDLRDGSLSTIPGSTLTFDDDAPTFVPGEVGVPTGTYKPTNEGTPGTDTFDSPAPAPSNATKLSDAFNGINPNGDWKLFAVDDKDGDLPATMAGGWSVIITTQVSAVTTTTAITSSDTTSLVGDPVTFTATVKADGSSVIGGTVQFADGSTDLGSVALTGGTAQFTTSALSEGTHTIRATYSGAPGFVGSTDTLSQQVDNATVVTDTTFCNPGSIAVPLRGQSQPYPSRIFVSGLPGTTTKVTAQLRNLSHTEPTDLDVLLAGPTPSTNLVLMSDAGGPNNADAPSVVNQTITFDDDASGDVPSPLVTGTYRPTNKPGDTADVYAGAPTPSSATTLATFNGSSANGTWTLWVVDDAQGSDSGSIAGGWCLTITSLKATTTALTATPTSPSTFGQPVTLKATVTSGGTPVTKGSVEFTEGATVLGGGPVNVGSDGTAQVEVTGLSAGDHTITATYTAPSEFAGSSTSVKQTVEKATTKTVLTSTPQPSRVGQEVTFTATVTVGDQPVPGGRVTFAIDGADQLPVTVDFHGSATFKTSALAAGDHQITAKYSGTDDLAASDDALQQTVSRVITSTALDSTLNPSRSGDEVTLTATVTAGESVVTEGSVEFTEGTTSLGIVAVGPDGKASLQRAFTVGSHEITATYQQTDTYATSKRALTQVVDQALTTTVVTDDIDPTSYGQDVTFTATITATASGDPLTGGTVQFSEGGTNLGGELSLNPDGTATLTANLLPAGPHTITATYTGTTEYADSSGSVDHTVDPADTTTTVVSSKTPSAFGQSVTFTATIAAVGTQVDTGTVEFADGGDVVCPAAPVSNGTATCDTSTLPVGTHTITATYSGSTNYVTSSGTVSQVIERAPTAITLATSGTPSNLGDEVTFTASATVDGGPLPDGTVAFSVDGTVKEAAATLDAEGHATFATATLTAGTHTITADYSGTPSYESSTSDTVDQVVVLLVDAGGPYDISEGEGVTLDGSGSSPGAESYEWDLNHDGTYGDVSGPTPTLTWSQLETFGINDGETSPTIYPVALQVKSGTETKVAETTIVVSNTAPTAVLTGDLSATVGVPFTIKVGADDPSSADMAANFTYTVDWGDGVVESVDGPADPPVTHTYATAGTVTASFTATDKDGGQSGSATIEIAVDPPGQPTTPPTTNPPTTNPTGHGGGGNGSLADTGASIGIGPIVFGAALLITGSALLVMARRRRAAGGGHE